jgi:hypothetical protein
MDAIAELEANVCKEILEAEEELLKLRKEAQRIQDSFKTATIKVWNAELLLDELKANKRKLFANNPGSAM